MRRSEKIDLRRLGRDIAPKRRPLVRPRHVLILANDSSHGKALNAVRGWPQDRQNEAAELLLALDRLGPAPYRASADELSAIDEALKQVARDKQASPAEVEEAFARFRK